jgi:hypothetical protein
MLKSQIRLDSGNLNRPGEPLPLLVPRLRDGQNPGGSLHRQGLSGHYLDCRSVLWAHHLAEQLCRPAVNGQRGFQLRAPLPRCLRLGVLAAGQAR